MRAKGERIPPAKKAAGITLASLGGVTILHDLHLFEQGSFNLGNLLRFDFGGGPSRVTVHDGGVSLKCDPDWIVRPFATGKSHYLDLEAVPAPSAAASNGLKAEVQALAEEIARDAPSGTVLLIGSGDQLQPLSVNANLAAQRAHKVKDLLHDSFGQGGAAPRDIVPVNEALTHPGVKGADGAQPLGLARLLYGAEEASARAVQACVLQPQAPAVEVSGDARPDLGFLGGLALGIAVASILFALVAPIAWAISIRRKAKPTASSRTDTASDKPRP